MQSERNQSQTQSAAHYPFHTTGQCHGNTKQVYWLCGDWEEDVTTKGQHW
jgi:hypothetical protein